MKSKWDAGEHRKLIAFNNTKTRSDIEGIGAWGGGVASTTKPTDSKVDLSAIARTKGQVGKMSIEDILLALDDVKGSVKKGEALFAKRGCIACHTTTANQPPKGPVRG